jgi:integrase
MIAEKDAPFLPPPEMGQIVQVRTRRFLVDRAEASPSAGGAVVGLLCVDDDAQGQALDVVWDLELEKSILDRDVWKSIGKKGFDDPRFFAAYMRTLRWNCVTAWRFNSRNATTQPMYNGEVGAVNAWLKARHLMQPHSNFLFLSERRKPLSRFTVCVLIKKYATAAGLGELEIHPHMLRHACGYSLANRGADTRLIQDYLGHKNITHTVRYTKLAPGRFTGLF